jgi:hypothetical protein
VIAVAYAWEGQPEQAGRLLHRSAVTYSRIAPLSISGRQVRIVYSIVGEPVHSGKRVQVAERFAQVVEAIVYF